VTALLLTFVIIPNLEVFEADMQQEADSKDSLQAAINKDT
jgi:hypothetical protein